MSARTHRMHFSRNELSYLADALESIIEEFKFEGGLLLAEPYMELENRVLEKMGLPANWLLPLTRSAAAGDEDG